jgi:hypothetical protein
MSSSKRSRLSCWMVVTRFSTSAASISGSTGLDGLAGDRGWSTNFTVAGSTRKRWRTVPGALRVSCPSLWILMISKTSSESCGMTLSPTCGGAVGVKSLPDGFRGYHRKDIQTVHQGHQYEQFSDPTVYRNATKSHQHLDYRSSSVILGGYGLLRHTFLAEAAAYRWEFCLLQSHKMFKLESVR